MTTTNDRNDVKHHLPPPAQATCLDDMCHLMQEEALNVVTTKSEHRGIKSVASERNSPTRCEWLKYTIRDGPVVDDMSMTCCSLQKTNLVKDYKALTQRCQCKVIYAPETVGSPNQTILWLFMSILVCLLLK